MDEEADGDVNQMSSSLPSAAVAGTESTGKLKKCTSMGCSRHSA